MKRLGRIVFVLCIVAGAAAVRGDMAEQIKQVVQDKLLKKAEVGIQLVRLGESAGEARIVYRLNGQMPLIPASNLKLATTAAALEKLGPQFKFRTMLAVRGEGSGFRVQGSETLAVNREPPDVALIGAGDPTFGDAKLLAKAGWDVTTVFQNWAAELKRRNISSVRNVVVDDSIFDESFKHPHWDAREEHKHYVAQVGGVNLNINVVDFQVRTAGSGQIVDYFTNPATRYLTVRNTCVGANNNAIALTRTPGTNDVLLSGELRYSTEVPVAVTVHDPPMYAATVLAETLAGAGIKVTGEVARDRTVRSNLDPNPKSKIQNPKWVVLAIHETPLAAALARANKDSVNLYAEALCKRLGADASGASGSWENGTAAVGTFLKSIGVAEDQFHLDDGSGLSKENAISPAAIVAVLAHEYHGPNCQTYLSSLAVAGLDGTLSDRFEGTDLRGRVFGKSGFVNGVSSLSGYLRAKDDQWYAFSILMNGIPSGSNSSIKPLHERIVRALDGNVADRK